MAGALDFHVCLRLSGQRVLVVGGGAVAEGRCDELLAVGANLHVVAPAVTPRLALLSSENRLALELRPFRAGDVRGHHLAFVATDDLDVSRAVAAEARSLGILINAADIPELCDFTLPSVGRKGPISVAVSTDGQAPALAARLRRDFVARVGHEHVQLARLVGWMRQRLPKGPVRMRLLKGVVDGEVAARLLGGDRGGAFKALRALLPSRGAES